MPGNAVVVGASVGGLVTARVLAEHFDRVTLIERQTLLLALNLLVSAPALFHPRLVARLLRGAGGTSPAAAGLAIGSPPMAPG